MEKERGPQTGSEWLSARYGENGRISMSDEAFARELDRKNSLDMLGKVKSMVLLHRDWKSPKQTDGGKYTMEDLIQDIEKMEEEVRL